MLLFYYHPLSSYCHKALIALYENDTPFDPVLVDLGNEQSRDEFYRLWPIGKFPVIKDSSNNALVPESSILIEYLDQQFPGKTRFIPSDPELARQTRMKDRFFDQYVHTNMQKIVGDRLRPAGSKDPLGVEQARAQLKTALDMTEKDLAGKTWSMGDAFTLADCAAAPALFYSNKVMPFVDSHPKCFAYLNRLMARPSYARTLKEAEPYFKFFPEK
jgi:glutathione S-transferase